MTRMTLLGALVTLLLAACGSEPPEAPPDPVVAAPPEQTAWGAPADGLQLGLEFPRGTFRVGEKITAVVRARNVGNQPLSLYNFDHDWYHQVTFTQVEEQVSWWGGTGLFIEIERPLNVTLAPGEDWEGTAELNDRRRRFLKINPDRRPGDDWDYRDSLPPGLYRASIGYEPGTREGTFYQGKPKSNEVEILIEE